MAAKQAMMAGSKGSAEVSPAKLPVPTTTYSKRVAARFRKLREAKGWTVADMAKQINRRLEQSDQLADSTVHGWDNGSRKIDPDFYPLVASVFGLTVHEFLPKR